MGKRMTRLGVLMLTAELLSGCAPADRGKPGYPAVLLSETTDPLVPERIFTPWRPPRQMAAFIHPHEDTGQGILIGGHWILILLGEGRWYFQEDADGDPVPDQDASPEELRRALGSLSIPRDAIIPFRIPGAGKP